MKKSNKLLLGGFLTVVLLITGIHIALFAKYKNGHYTVYHREDSNGPLMQPFPNVSFVTLRNIHGATVLFNTNAEIQKGKEDFIQYEQKGDSLIITGRPDDGLPEGRHRLTISLPRNVNLSAVNSVLHLFKGKEAVESNPVIHLENSHAIFVDDNNPLHLGHAKIVAWDNSIVSFHGDTQVDHLEARLTNSTLEYNEGDVGQLSIVADSVSRVSLLSKHLLKAKITTVSNNP